MGNQRGRPMKARPRIYKPPVSCFSATGLMCRWIPLPPKRVPRARPCTAIFPAAKTRCCWRRSRFSMTPCSRPCASFCRIVSRIFPRCCAGLQSGATALLCAGEYSLSAPADPCWCKARALRHARTAPLRPRIAGAERYPGAETRRRSADPQRPGARGDGVSRRDYGLSAAGGLNCAKAVAPERLEQLAECAISAFLTASGYRQ